MMAACAVAFKGERAYPLCAEYGALALGHDVRQSRCTLSMAYVRSEYPEARILHRQGPIITFFWAATMLFKATGDLKYRDEALFYAMAGT
jgi:hypothetical protein